MACAFIPQNLVYENKQGFSAPDSSWFRSQNASFIKDKLMNKKSNIYNLLDFNVTSNLVDSHLQGKENKRLLIWSLLYLNEWIKQNF